MTTLPSGYSVAEAVQMFLDTLQKTRSANTSRTYANALRAFILVLKEHWIEPDSPISNLTESGASWMLSHLKAYTAATERLYIQAVKGFYQFLAGENFATINLPKLDLIIKQRSRRTGQRLPQFPRENIEKIIEYVNNITIKISDNHAGHIRALRDRAFLFTLADTGLRVNEACSLRRGDIDWNEGRAIIVGKGDKQALVRFSSRSLQALRDYLAIRAEMDGATGRPLTSLPLFARHDRGAGKKVKSITTATGRNIVNDRARQALGDNAGLHITPHSFRHYFVTTVLRASGNLKLAQELARHANIQVTQRYAHLSNDELDKGYHEIFES